MGWFTVNSHPVFTELDKAFDGPTSVILTAGVCPQELGTVNASARSEAAMARPSRVFFMVVLFVLLEALKV
jgi:hypothetical protein